MKATFIFGLILMFAYAGFRPPEGMRKFPVANFQFQVQTAQGTATVTVNEILMSSVEEPTEQEEE